MSIKSVKLITPSGRDSRNVVEVRLSKDAAFPIFITEEEVKLIRLFKELYGR